MSMLEGPEQNPELGLLAHYCFYVIANLICDCQYICDAFM